MKKMLNCDEVIDELELYTMIQRIYALLAFAPQDDFYRWANRDWLENGELRAGEPASSVLDDMAHEVELEVGGIIDSILSGVWHKGSREQKVSDVYMNIMNMDSRNQFGCKPILPYLEAIDISKNLYSLDKALYAISRDLGIDLFFSFSLEPSIKNGSKYAVYLTCPAPALPKKLAQDLKSPQMEALTQYASTLFKLAGIENPDVKAEAVARIERLLAIGQRDPTQPINYAEDYKQYSISKLKKQFPAADIVMLGALSGLRPEESYCITDTRLFGAFASIYEENNLEAVKAYAAYRLLDECSGMLSQPFLEARYILSNAILGTPQMLELERDAIAKTISLTSDYLGEMYVDKYLSLSVKRDVEAMARVLTDTLIERIDEIDWLGADSKETAKKKLEALDIKIGMPQKWDSVMDSVNIRGPAEGGTYFENVTEYYRQFHALIAKRQGKPVDRDAWDISVLTINACYKSITNEIIIPAAMLQSPLYMYRGEKEANYGGIGSVIAHELIHVIDYYGEQFDEMGNARHWWTDEEKAAFMEIYANVSAHYGGYEAAPGLINNGELTVMENIADLGMITCVLSAVEALPDPDYRLFFMKAAGLWADTSMRSALELYLCSNNHSSGNARVNKTFQNFDQFYDVFNINQGDGMYIPPEYRLNVW